MEPGTVIETTSVSAPQRPQDESSNSPAVCLQTGRGILAALQLQRAGRRSLSAADFLRGMPDIVGKRLGSP